MNAQMSSSSSPDPLKPAMGAGDTRPKSRRLNSAKSKMAIVRPLASLNLQHGASASLKLEHEHQRSLRRDFLE